jgi:putative tryptophan/tyrosine transport system substrate-binding protein
MMTGLSKVAAFGVLTLASWLPAAYAQEAAKVWRIGRLSPLTQETDAPMIEAFKKGLRELGWAEGKNFAIETRLAQGQLERLPELAQDLVQRRVDIILVGSTPGILAAKNATRTIPLIMVTTGDPVADGLVESLARPGGNVTGVTTLAQELNAKRMQLLKEAVPGVTRVAVLTNPGTSYARAFAKEKDLIARALGVKIQVLEAAAPSAFEKALSMAISGRAEALSVLTDPMFVANRNLIVEWAASKRLPAIYGDRAFVEAGGLLFYGASLTDMYRRVAGHADKIFRGAKPADLPVEQPTRFEFIVNLKAVRQLGVNIPQSVLLRADQVIE